MSTFHINPAPLRKARGYRLENDRLTALSASGRQDWELDLSAVTAVQLSGLGQRGAALRQLDLKSGDTLRRISCNAPPDSPSDTAHRALSAAVLSRLSELNPGLKVELGQSRATGWVFFGLGLASLVGAAAILSAALATGVSGGRLIGAAVPLVLMVGLGALLCSLHAPWRPRPQLPAGKLAARLTSADSHG